MTTIEIARSTEGTCAPVESVPITVLDPEVRDVLAKAKGLIAQGWCQGALTRGGQRCVLGAVAAAVNGKDEPLSLFYAARGVLADTLGGRSLAQWNDVEGRSHADVVSLFDRVLTGGPH